MREIDNFYLSKNEPNKSCLLALREMILGENSEISETQKWGMPCFCFHKNIVCYLWIDKKTDEPYILVVDGNRLDHPKLEAGKRSKMKIFRVNPNQDLPVNTIRYILQACLDLYRSELHDKK